MILALEIQKVGRILRPSTRHLMQSDPCDPFNLWPWSCTAHVAADSDPCDDWPYFSFGGNVAFVAGFDFTQEVVDGYVASLTDRFIGEYRGHQLDFIVIDECHNIPAKTYCLGGKTAELRDRMTAAEALELVKQDPPLPYDYQRHNKTRKRR